ncbi:hypothetical protein, partial [Clavibacter michiganensis]
SNDSSPGANLPMVDSNEYAQKRLGAIGTWLLLAGIVLFLIAVASTLVLASNILTLEHVFRTTPPTHFIGEVPGIRRLMLIAGAAYAAAFLVSIAGAWVAKRRPIRLWCITFSVLNVLGVLVAFQQSTSVIDVIIGE